MRFISQSQKARERNYDLSDQEKLSTTSFRKKNVIQKDKRMGKCKREDNKPREVRKKTLQRKRRVWAVVVGGLVAKW